MTDLNPAQRSAIHYTSGPLLVLAGAGSGKTRVITHKIAHLIGEVGMSPRHIAAVTFTNKAAREMKQRVARLLTGREGKGLTVSTFHTLGLNILRREAAAAGLAPGFSIYDPRDAEALLAELLKREALGQKDYVDRVRNRISLWKNALLEPEAALAAAQDGFEQTAALAYAAYERQLRAYNAADLDDLIRLPVRIFESEAEILDRWQNRLHYLLIDEYQDTNAAQYQLVRLLTGVRRGLTAVGDDDQSIYAWRGARPENLRQLQADFPDLKVIKLEQNYRSTGRILAAANRLIAGNPHVFEKRLWSELGPGDPIRVVECRDELHEAERVVSELIGDRFQQRASYGDYAILFRGNHQARPFEKALREHGIPYVLAGGQSFFDATEVKDLLAYLRLLANPQDSAAFFRIANVPRREIGPSTLEKLAHYAAERGVGPVEASLELGLEAQVGARPLSRLRQFADWLEETAARAAGTDPATAARALVEDLGYESWLRSQYDEPQAERRLANVQELLGWIERLAGEGEGEADLGALMARITLLDVLDRADAESTGDRVTLTTLHAAKGLEFPHVFMVGMEENLLPHRTSIEEETIEEERRLAYVGLTRARRRLTLTLARRRRRYGEIVTCEPSRFLAELPAEHLEWEGEQRPVDPERRRARGQAHLAVLRGLLAGE